MAIPLLLTLAILAQGVPAADQMLIVCHVGS